jgi:hypothetical protein
MYLASLTSFSSLWFIVMSWLSGVDVPLGVPPLPPDPALSAVAPQQCLCYVSSAGMAAANPTSRNQTERLMAEPELRQMVLDIEKAIKTSLAETMKERDMPESPSADAILALAKMPLLRPFAVYVSEVKPGPDGPAIRGGLVLNLGDEAGKWKAVIDQLIDRELPAPADSVTIAGRPWRQLKPSPGLTIAWGQWEKYLVVGLGDGEAEAMLKRLGTSSPARQAGPTSAGPAFLAKLRHDLPVDRLSTLSYVNLKAIGAQVIPSVDPQAAAIWKAIGLDGATEICSVTGLAGEGFQGKTLIRLGAGPPQGIFRLADIKPLKPDDLAVIPSDATLAVAVKLDPAELFETVRVVADRIDPGAKQRIDEAIREAEEHTGLKLRDDVFKALGDTWRIFSSPSEGGSYYGLLAVASLRDARKAAATSAKLASLVESALASLPAGGRPYYYMVPKLHTLEFAGKTIHTCDAGYYTMPLCLSWCVTDKELVVGLFPQAIKAYLSRPGDFKSLARSPAAAELFPGGQAGPMKVVYLDSRRVYDGVYTSILYYAKYFPMIMMMRGGVRRESSIDFAMLVPSPRAVRPHLRPALSAVRRTAAGIEIVGRQSLPGGGAVVALPAGIGALLFGLGPMLASHGEQESIDHLMVIGAAIHNYESSHGTFPPAYTTDANGKPLLSWRVLILPYLREDDLYQQFHLGEPWDSAHNKKLIARMPAVFKSPGSKVAGQGKTNYLTVRGDDTIFPGEEKITPAQVTDGLSSTIMTVEASDAKAVVWTKPDDLAYDDKKPLAGLVGLRRDGFLAGFADGHVRRIKSSVKPETLNALFTRDGGETVGEDDF